MEKEKEVKGIQLAGSVWVELLGKGITLVTGFAILWILSTESYGFVKVIENTVSIVLVFANPGLTVAVLYLVPASLEGNNQRNPVVYLLAAASIMLLAFAVVILLTPFVLIQLGLAEYFGFEFILCMGGTFLSILALLVQNFVTGLHEYTKSLYLQTLQAVTRFIVIPFSILMLSVGYFLGTLTIGILIFIVSSVFAWKSVQNLQIPFSLNWSEFTVSLRRVFSYSQMLFGSKIARQVYFTAPVIILASISDERVALFAVAFMLTTLIQVFPVAITRYLLPTLTGLMARDNYERVTTYYRNGIGFVISVAVAINVALLLFPEAVLWLLRPSYLASIPHFAPLALASIFFCIWFFDSVLFYSSGKVLYSVITEVIIASISILVSLVMLPILGDTSVSWGLAIGLGIGLFVQQAIMRKAFSISIGKKTFLKTLLLLLVLLSLKPILLSIANTIGLQESIFLSIMLAGSIFIISIGLSIAVSLIPRKQFYSFLNMIFFRDRKEEEVAGVSE